MADRDRAPNGKRITHVAFLRAINVAGHASVRMTDLVDAFKAAGCAGVRSYIQSGNVIFESTVKRSPGLCRRIRVKLRDLLGQEPGVLFRTVGELADVVRVAPFRALETDRRIKLYVVFLSQRPLKTPTFPLVNSKEELEAVGMTNLEVFVVSRRKKSGFYGFPNNFIEKELGISATSRNWSTVTRLVTMIRQERAAQIAAKV